ncbi:MAG: hypothetical protein Q8O67_32610 [Deltaproteobacteria bacterium]|nr:hypothetical protein [Deltaproteobacteria bacterium]
MLATLLLLATLPPPICDVPLEHVTAEVTAKKEQTKRHFISCFGARTERRDDDEFHVKGAIAGDNTGGWSVTIKVINVRTGITVYDEQVTKSPAAKVQAIILEARASTTPEWHAARALKRAEEAERLQQAAIRKQAEEERQREAAVRRKAIFKDVVIVVDAHLALPPPERAALEMVLRRLREHGLDVVENVDAASKAAELTSAKVLLLTANMSASEDGLASPMEGRSSWRLFTVNARILLHDGTTRVGDESWSISNSGINVDKAMQTLSERKQTGVEPHADRLVTRLVDYFHLEEAKRLPPLP